MKEIISKFEELASKEQDPDKHLIGNIHDKIFELNAEGENRLAKLGRGAVLLRDIKTLFSFSNFHVAFNDRVESRHLFTKENINIKHQADKIIKDFDTLHNKTDSSRQLIKDIFSENNDKGSVNTEKTKNAIRYIAHNNPKKALEIIEYLNGNLNGMSLHPINPEEFTKSLANFLSILTAEICSATKHRSTSTLATKDNIHSLGSNLPLKTVNILDPIANIKKDFGNNFSIILNKNTKQPEVQFIYDSKEDRLKQHESLLDAITESAALCFYQAPQDESLFPSENEMGSDEDKLQGKKGDKYIQTLSTHATMLISWINGEHFMKTMYEHAWKQNNEPENVSERTKILEGVIRNLNSDDVRDFFQKNDVHLDSEYFVEGESNTPLYSILEENPEMLKKLQTKQILYNLLPDFDPQKDSSLNNAMNISDENIIPFEELAGTQNDIAEQRSTIISTIQSTPPIAQDYTSESSIDEQRIAHETSKAEGFAKLKILGASVEVVSPAHHLIPEISPKYEDIVIDRKLNPAVFSWEATNGLQADIIKDGKREDENIVIYIVETQFNGCESSGRNTPKPGSAVETYKKDKLKLDRIQGPPAQLAFDPLQVETTTYMANLGFNGLANLLTEDTKDAVQHGYLSPTRKNIDHLNFLFKNKTEREKIEFLCIANQPLEGTKPVHQILISAPAFGKYSIDGSIFQSQKLDLQF
ncbi:MAG TPA: hypothetical protein VGP47_09295, partial [Parachlamydiaceae bacterium]|nr:hypothetical protein [Parachlamydiaceae bacterium]